MISEILRDIPWLPIDIDIDIVKLQQEYKFICENYRFEKYSAKDGPTATHDFVKEKYANAWSGISFVSSDGSLYNDLRRGKGINYTPSGGWGSTELENYCKYSFQLIDSFFARKSRCRIMRISPQSSLAFHSHVLEHGQSERTLTIQIPIEMPENFEYCVVEEKEFTKDKRFALPSSFKNIYRGKLDLGKAYYFNSYHYHNVFNYSNTYRAVIMLYVSLNIENVKQLIKKSLVKEGFIK
jgi:hypothetical protein